MPETPSLELAQLQALYTIYLKALCPDWDDARIEAEIQAVFEEQGVYHSLKRRRLFQEKLLAQLALIQQRPDDWFLDTGD